MEKRELEAIVARIGLSIEQIAKERAAADKERAAAAKERREADKRLAEQRKELDKRLAEERRESDKRFEERMKSFEQERIKSEKRAQQERIEWEQERKKIDKRLAEERSESDKRFAERMKSLEQEHRVLAQEHRQWVEERRESGRLLDKRIDDLAKMYGGASNNQGEAAEEFFYNSLAAKPELNGVHFDVVTRNYGRVKDDIRDEFDLILANGSDVFVVEVKYKLRESHIEQMLNQKQPNFSVLFPEYQGYRHHWNLASFHCSDELKEIALGQGINILQRKGDIIETIAA